MKTLVAGLGPAAILLFALAGTGDVALGSDFLPTGRWVLVRELGVPTELAIIEVLSIGDNLDARLIDTHSSLAEARVERFEYRDGHIALALLDRRAKEVLFDGTLATKGRYVGQALGTIRRADISPARLEKTTAVKLATTQPPAYQKLHLTAIDTADLKKRSALLAEVLRQAASPAPLFAFAELLKIADEAGLSEQAVRAQIDAYLAQAEPYGPAIVARSRLLVLRCLRDQRRFAPLALEIGEQARKRLDDVDSPERQASTLRFLAAAAEATGHSDISRDAESQAEAIDQRLDADYRAKTPPFKVEPYHGRARSKRNRVVLLELFTGAQCGPCVAADVASDALAAAFQPSELVFMQYHLHIPGPDALTNPSTMARADYYGFRGVPTALFNGEESPSHGGDLQASETKYQEYRQRVEDLLASANDAKIDFSVDRSANQLAIRATARASSLPAGRPAATNDDNSNAPKSELRLRLALTEELVRYDGGNGVRLNRHVVRGFPGGTEGKPLMEGQLEVELTVDLDDVRRRLNDYNEGIAKRLALTLSPVPKAELKHISVVAFVQDDATKKVLHAVRAVAPEK